jgi:hypothetical protein
MQHYIQYWDEQGRDNREILRALYREPLIPAVQEELDYLLRRYGSRLRYGKAHPAPCSVWRSERSLYGASARHKGRFVNRVHIFEDRWPPDRGTREGKDWDDQFDEQERVWPSGYDYPAAHQRYLGYVSLRPREFREFRELREPGRPFLRYTAVCVLTPPMFMLRPRFHLITCMAGPPDGVLPFRATPYCGADAPEDEHDFETNRAPCLHSALHACLLLKANNYQCRPITAQDMVALTWQMDHAGQMPSRPANGGADDAGTKWSMSEWNHEGLTLEGALQILRHEEVGAGGILETFVAPEFQTANELKEPEEYVRRVSLDAVGSLLDYVGSGVPCVLEIHPTDKEGKRQKMGHATMVFGYRLMNDPDDDWWPLPPDPDDELLERVDYQELPGRFVLHDGLYGPYHMIQTARLIKMAWTRPTAEVEERLKKEFAEVAEEAVEEAVEEAGTREEPDGVRFIPILPHGARIGVQAVRALSFQHFAAFPHDLRPYLTEELHYPPGLLDLLLKDATRPDLDQATLTGRITDFFRKCRGEEQEAAAKGESKAVLPWREAEDERRARRVGRELAWALLPPDGRGQTPRFVTRLVGAEQILGRYVVDGNDRAIRGGDAYEKIARALATYQQWYNRCLRPRESPAVLRWWAVEIRAPLRSSFAPARGREVKDSAEDHRSLPGAVLCWPVITPDRSRTVPSGGPDFDRPALRFLYAAGRRARYDILYYPPGGELLEPYSSALDPEMKAYYAEQREKLLEDTRWPEEGRAWQIYNKVKAAEARAAGEGDSPWKVPPGELSWGIRDA